MKERKRRQSLGGAVLIMVLTVMFILMILLMAALTTVSTANQRIFTKFEENQAYYTARSALDVFVQNMISDRDYVAYKYTPSTGAQGAKREYTYGDNKKAEMKQGLGVQLDIYSITAQSGTNFKQSFLYGYANTLTGDAKKDEYKYYFGVKPGTTGSSDGADINAIYYEVELPKTADSSSTYGKLSDRVNGVSKAKIKIEVLERRYDMGSVSVTVGGTATTVSEYVDSLDKNAANYQTTLDAFMNNTTYKNDIAKAIIMGDREQDKMRLKITATTEYDGVEGTAVLIIDTADASATVRSSSSRSITSISDLSEHSGMYPIGGASALFDGQTKMSTASITTGDIFLQGGLYSEDVHHYMTRGSSIILARGDVHWANISAPDIKAKGATMFISGALTMEGGTTNGTGGRTFGNSGTEANLVVGTLKFQSNFNGGFYGNVYCDTLDLSGDSGNFKVVNGSAYANTLILSAGSWTDTNTGVLHITINVPASAASIKVGSDIIAMQRHWDGTVIYKITNLSGTPTVVNGDGTPVVGAVVDPPSGVLPTVNSANKVNIDFDDYTTNPVRIDPVEPPNTPNPDNPYETEYRIFTMPADIILPDGVTLTGDKKREIKIPTSRNLYYEYFNETGRTNPTMTFDAHGSFNFTPSSPVLSDADRRNEFRDFLDDHVKLSEEKLGYATLDQYTNYVTIEERDSELETNYAAAYAATAADSSIPQKEKVKLLRDLTPIPSEFTKVISGSGRLLESDRNGNTNNLKLYAIDARKNNIEIQLGSDSATAESYYAGIFVVFGNHQVKFLLAGDQKINIGGPTSTCEFEVYTWDIYNATELKLGEMPDRTPAPNIDLYSSKNAKNVGFGHQAFVCGYFYTPMSQFDFEGGLNGKEYATKYDGHQVYYTSASQKPAYGVAGAVLCHGYSSAQKVGVAYIERDGDDDDGGNYGEPIHQWTLMQYIRG